MTNPPSSSAKPGMVLRDWIFLMSFVVWLGIPGIGQLLGHSSVKDIKGLEFREAAPRASTPESVQELGVLPYKIDAYISDHFGFRLQMGRMYSSLLAAFGSSASERVLIGEQGWLYLTGGTLADEFRGTLPVKNRSYRAWLQGASDFHETMQTQGISHVITLIPSKWSVYSEHLPAWAQPKAPTRYHNLAARLNELEHLPFVDARPRIMAEKTEGESRLFKKVDTHWTTRAAYITYLQIMAELEGKVEGLEPLVLEDLVITQGPPPRRGDLSRFLHSTPLFNEPSFVTYQVKQALHENPQAWIVKGNGWKRAKYAKAALLGWKVAYRSNATCQARLLVYGDSFTSPMKQFLVHTFAEVVFVRHVRGVSDSDFMRSVDPQIVLLNINERAARHRPTLDSRSPGLDVLRWQD